MSDSTFAQAEAFAEPIETYETIMSQIAAIVPRMKQAADPESAEALKNEAKTLLWQIYQNPDHFQRVFTRTYPGTPLEYVRVPSRVSSEERDLVRAVVGSASVVVFGNESAKQLLGPLYVAAVDTPNAERTSELLALVADPSERDALIDDLFKYAINSMEIENGSGGYVPNPDFNIQGVYVCISRHTRWDKIVFKFANKDTSKTFFDKMNEFRMTLSEDERMPFCLSWISGCGLSLEELYPFFTEIASDPGSAVQAFSLFISEATYLPILQSFKGEDGSYPEDVVAAVGQCTEICSAAATEFFGSDILPEGTNLTVIDPQGFNGKVAADEIASDEEEDNEEEDEED